MGCNDLTLAPSPDRIGKGFIKERGRGFFCCCITLPIMNRDRLC